MAEKMRNQLDYGLKECRGEVYNNLDYVFLLYIKLSY